MFSKASHLTAHRYNEVLVETDKESIENILEDDLNILEKRTPLLGSIGLGVKASLLWILQNVFQMLRWVLIQIV